MLDQLVESKSHAAEDTKRSGFLLDDFHRHGDHPVERLAL